MTNYETTLADFGKVIAVGVKAAAEGVMKDASKTLYTWRVLDVLGSERSKTENSRCARKSRATP